MCSSYVSWSAYMSPVGRRRVQQSGGTAGRERLRTEPRSVDRQTPVGNDTPRRAPAPHLAPRIGAYSMWHYIFT